MQMKLCIRLELFMSGSKHCEKLITNMSLSITVAYVGLSRDVLHSVDIWYVFSTSHSYRREQVSTRLKYYVDGPGQGVGLQAYFR
jgi:hypothetical protein